MAITQTTVPRSETEKLELLTVKPSAWEYLLFGYYLRAGIGRAEEKWRDYSLGYTLKVGPVVEADDVPSFVSEHMSLASGLAENVERVMSQRAQELAFGLPGEPGDADMIEHMASRLVSLYEALLDWASDLLAVRFPEGSNLGEMGSQLVSQPIEAVRAFSRSFVDDLEDGLRRLRDDPEQELNLQLTLSFEIDEAAADQMVAEVKRIVGVD